MKIINKIILAIIIIFLIVYFLRRGNFLEFLNSNSGAFNVIFTFVVALATVFYVILTSKLVSETRRLRIIQTIPDVITIIQPREEWINFVDMIIKNIGSGPAYNIKFEVNPDFEYDGGQFLSKMSFFEKGIDYLAPNQKLQFFMTSLAQNFDKKINKPFNIKIKFEDRSGKSYTNNFRIDLSQLASLNQLGEPPIYKIAKDIEKIRGILERKIK